MRLTNILRQSFQIRGNLNVARFGNILPTKPQKTPLEYTFVWATIFAWLVFGAHKARHWFEHKHIYTNIRFLSIWFHRIEPLCSLSLGNIVPLGVPTFAKGWYDQINQKSLRQNLTNSQSNSSYWNEVHKLFAPVLEVYWLAAICIYLFTWNCGKVVQLNMEWNKNFVRVTLSLFFHVLFAIFMQTIRELIWLYQYSRN